MTTTDMHTSTTETADHGAFVANMATGCATVLYHHFHPRAREYRELLDGQQRPVHTDEEALAHARRLEAYATELVARLELRIEHEVAS